MGQKGVKFFGQIEQDRGGFKHPCRGRRAVIHQGRNLRIRIDLHEPTAELVPVTDLDQPGIVFGIGLAEGEQLLEHHRDLHTIGRGQ